MKSDATVQVNIRMPQALNDKLHDLAWGARLSKNAYMVEILSRHVRGQGAAFRRSDGRTEA